MRQWKDWRHCLILSDVSYIRRQEEFLRRQNTPPKKFYGLLCKPFLSGGMRKACILPRIGFYKKKEYDL